MGLAMQPLRKGQIDVSTPVVVIAPGYHGHTIARSLGRLGVPVYGVHADALSPAASSKYWRRNYIWDLNTASPEQSVAWLLDLGRTIGSHPLLMPTDDGSCLFVADHADALREAFRIPNQPPGLTRKLSSKKDMYHLCKTHGIPVAETVFPQTRDEVVAFCQTAQFPIMLKGIDTVAVLRRTGVKMVVAHDAETLLERYDAMETPDDPSLMLQEYFPGGSQMTWMFNGYFDSQSQCLFGHTGRMIRQYPAYTGRTSLGLYAANEVVAQQTRAFMQAIGYCGPLDIGYKYEARSGQYKAIDVNPRTGTTFRLFVDSMGMDVVRACYLDMTGQKVACGEMRPGRKWMVENFDLVSSPRYIRQEKLGLGGWLRSYRGVEEVCWFAPDDPAPFFAMGARSIAWAWNRATGGKGSGKTTTL